MIGIRAFVRCRVVGRHRWHVVGGAEDPGWRCRDCDELVLERYLLERNHDWEAGNPTWGHGSGTGFGGHIGALPPGA